MRFRILSTEADSVSFPVLNCQLIRWSVRLSFPSAPQRRTTLCIPTQLPNHILPFQMKIPVHKQGNSQEVVHQHFMASHREKSLHCTAAQHMGL